MYSPTYAATPDALDSLVSIPPELDRALARTVLDEVRGARRVGQGLAPTDDPPPALAESVAGVVDALRAQGARASEVLLAVEDAFAALLAGQRGAAERRHVAALDGQARQVVAARLGYGA